MFPLSRIIYDTDLEYLQLPNCSPYPGPLSILILDNVKIHHNGEFEELADHFGIRIEYLPPYLPNFNPIE
jgi:transposase